MKLIIHGFGGPGMCKHANSHIHKHTYGRTHAHSRTHYAMCRHDLQYVRYIPSSTFTCACVIYACIDTHTRYFVMTSRLSILMGSRNFQGYYPHILRRGLNIITDKTSSSGDYLCDVQ